MGKQSNLGPIDPQMGGVACQAVLDEFQKAKDEIGPGPNIDSATVREPGTSRVSQS